MSSVNAASVGLVGLGAMGRGVAANLLTKGFDVVGFDLRPESYIPHIEVVNSTELPRGGTGFRRVLCRLSRGLRARRGHGAGAG